MAYLKGDQDQLQQQQYYYSQNNQSRPYQMVKLATAVATGGSLLLLSGLTMAGTVVALTIVTPLFVIFSPVLVPAIIAATLIMIGFVAAGTFGVASIAVLTWMYRYVTGKRPFGADQLDQARNMLANKAWEVKDRAGPAGQFTGTAAA